VPGGMAVAVEPVADLVKRIMVSVGGAPCAPIWRWPVPAQGAMSADARRA
jgi:hypothetical protein